MERRNKFRNAIGGTITGLAALVGLNDGAIAQEANAGEGSSASEFRLEFDPSAINDTAPPISVSSKTDYLSKYIYYGVLYSEDPVVQESLTVSIGNWNLTGFVNYDAKSEEINETDLILDGFVSVGDDLTLFGGYAFYTSPTDVFETTHEIFGGVSFDKLPLTPTLLFVHDVGAYGGLYGQLSLSHQQELFDFGRSGKVSLSAEGILGFNNGYYREGSGFSHLEGKLELPIELGNNVSIAPSLTYIHGLDNDFDDHLIYGLSLRFNF